MKVRLANGIVQVLQLDDAEVRKTFDVEYRQATKSEIEVTAEPASFRNLLSDCEDRQNDAWDQPPSWCWSAKAAADRIRTALAKEESS